MPFTNEQALKMHVAGHKFHQFLLNKFIMHCIGKAKQSAAFGDITS